MPEAAVSQDPKVAPLPSAADGAKEPVLAPSAAPAEDKAAEALGRIAEKERAHRKAVEKWEAQRKTEEEGLKEIRELAVLKAEYRKTRDPRLAAKILEYEDPTEMIRESAVRLQGVNKPKTADDRVAELERRLADSEKATEARQKKADEDAEKKAKADEESKVAASRKNHQTQMRSFIEVADNEAQYPELASLDNPGREISDHIWNHWQKTYDPEAEEGEVLSPEKAAATLEAYLVKRADKAAAIRAKHKKLPEAKKEEAPKPAPEAKTASPKSGEEHGPEAKDQGQKLDYETMTYAELRTINPDKLSDEDRRRVSVALLDKWEPPKA